MLLAALVLVLATHLVHEEQGSGEQEDHDRERKERGTAIFTCVDELLREKHDDLLGARRRYRYRHMAALLRLRWSISYQWSPSNDSPKSRIDGIQNWNTTGSRNEPKLYVMIAYSVFCNGSHTGAAPGGVGSGVGHSSAAAYLWLCQKRFFVPPPRM